MRWTRLWCSVGGWKPASGVSAGRLAALHQELSTQCPFPGTAPPDPGEAPEGREEDGDRKESSAPCSAPGRWPAPDHRDFNQEPAGHGSLPIGLQCFFLAMGVNSCNTCTGQPGPVSLQLSERFALSLLLVLCLQMVLPLGKAWMLTLCCFGLVLLQELV